MTTTQTIETEPTAGPDELLAEYAALQRKKLAMSADSAVMLWNDLLDEISNVEAAIKDLAHKTGASWKGSGWQVKTTVPVKVTYLAGPFLDYYGAEALEKMRLGQFVVDTNMVERLDKASALDEGVVYQARVETPLAPRTSISPMPLEDVR